MHESTMRKKTVPHSWAIENAIAQQRLEGLEPSPQVIADLRRVEQGEMTFAQVIANIKKRVSNDQILQP